MENKDPISDIFSFSSLEMITKKMLCIVTGMKPRTFTKFLTTLEPDIKKISPRYNKNNSILKPKEADFIVEELGLNLNDVRAAHKNMLNPNRNKKP